MSEEEHEPRENREDPGEESAGADPYIDQALDPEVEIEPVEEAQGSPEDPAVEEPGAGEEWGLPAVLAKLEGVERERDEYLDALRRLKAEFENYRRRQERERERLAQTAAEKLVGELLPVMDNLERAIEAGGDIRGGVEATREQLSGVLEREGVTPLASDGQHFDPNVHEAVMSQPSEEHEEGTIIQTFQRGYVLNGRPIRPAKVVVARQE